MLMSVEGTFRNGKVELNETPPELVEGRVIVTFLSSNEGKPPEFTQQELAELRGKLASWEEDWSAPGMEAYIRPQAEVPGRLGTRQPSPWSK